MSLVIHQLCRWTEMGTCTICRDACAIQSDGRDADGDALPNLWRWEAPRVSEVAGCDRYETGLWQHYPSSSQTWNVYFTPGLPLGHGRTSLPPSFLRRTNNVVRLWAAAAAMRREATRKGKEKKNCDSSLSYVVDRVSTVFQNNVTGLCLVYPGCKLS